VKRSEVLRCSDGLSNKVSNIVRRHVHNIKLLLVCSLGSIFYHCIYGCIKDSAEALVAATREIGLGVSADKTKYMVMSRDRNAGRIHSVRMNNSTFERVEEF
jgi:hypothetical protein